jgi:hypothetical protein
LKLLKFGDRVIVVGNVCYNNSKKGIIRRASKRPRTKEPSSQGEPKRNIEWDITKDDPQREAEETIAILNAFIGANSFIVNELNCLLEDYKGRVTSLEQQM